MLFIARSKDCRMTKSVERTFKLLQVGSSNAHDSPGFGRFMCVRIAARHGLIRISLSDCFVVISGKQISQCQIELSPCAFRSWWFLIQSPPDDSDRGVIFSQSQEKRCHMNGLSAI